MILAIAERIEDGAEDEELRQWKRVLLSYAAVFVDCQADDDRYFRCSNIRLKAKGASKVMTHKSSQLIFDIHHFKVRKEAATNAKLSKEQIATLYKNGLDLTFEGNEETDKDHEKQDRSQPGTVDAALSVYDRLFAHDVLRDLVLDAEREWLEDSPFNGIYKLHSLVNACKASVSKLEWVIRIVILRVRAGSLRAGEFSTRNMAGRSGRQFVDIFVTQKAMKDHLLGPFLDGRGFHSQAKADLRAIFASPNSYIQKLRPLREDDAIDVSFQATWPASAFKMCELLETAAFSASEDSVIRIALKNAKSAEECISEYQPFKGHVESIDEMLALELKGTDSGIGAAGGAGGAEGGATSRDEAGAAAMDAGGAFMDDSDLGDAAKLQMHAQRVMAASCVLIVEEGLTQTKLANALAEHSVMTVSAEARMGTFVYIFDVNSFGEAQTGPHIRKPPIQSATWNKLVNASMIARHGTSDAASPLRVNEVFVLVDGGRQNNALFTKTFQAGLLQLIARCSRCLLGFRAWSFRSLAMCCQDLALAK